jgi:hypothetical protein
MKVEDLKILTQLSLETQTRMKFELTVSELFTYARLLSDSEMPKQTKTIVSPKTLPTEIKQEVTPLPSPVTLPESEASAEAEEIEEIEGLYYTVRDVADIYNTSLNTVYVWLKKGLLKEHHRKGRYSYFAKSDVEKIKRTRGKRLKRKKPLSESEE